MDFWTPEQLRSIDKMLNPRSIAVVGASPKGGYGGRLVNAVLRAKDRVKIYPVNPNYEEIGGLRATRAWRTFPKRPTSSASSCPTPKCSMCSTSVTRRRPDRRVVISAGFAERGTESGLDLQRQVGKFARESGFAWRGPTAWASPMSETISGRRRPRARSAA